MSRAWFLLPVLLALGVPPGAWADETPSAATSPVEAAAADAASDIGRSIFVASEVQGQTGDAPAKKIAVNDDIVFNEDITTGADAKTVIEFRDGSTFEVGPDAVVRIDSFVFNPEESTSQKTLQVTRGVFRYVSGYVAGNQEAKIVSPTGALAIRGSVAEGIVDPEETNFVNLGEGSATVTNSAGSRHAAAGQRAIAVPSASTPPMAAAAMPAPVAAQDRSRLSRSACRRARRYATARRRRRGPGSKKRQGGGRSGAGRRAGAARGRAGDAGDAEPGRARLARRRAWPLGRGQQDQRPVFNWRGGAGGGGRRRGAEGDPRAGRHRRNSSRGRCA